MIQEITGCLHLNALNRMWVISDLQQSDYENAEHCMKCAVADYKRLGLNCERIIYLGDAVEGSNLDVLIKMTQMQIDELESIGSKICYALGNHDFDYFNANKSSLNKIALPFYYMVKNRDMWRVSDEIEDFYFIEEFDDFACVYLTDHASRDGGWIVTHGTVHGQSYPHDEAAYLLLREKIARIDKPVFTFSHYSFPGGNRPSTLFSQLLPLPDNVKIHFYGHAHIGDKVWAGKNCYQKISSTDNQDIPQINAASLENIRGNAIRSVFFEIYDDSYGILFRNHSEQKWDEIFLIDKR